MEEDRKECEVLINGIQGLREYIKTIEEGCNGNVKCKNTSTMECHRVQAFIDYLEEYIYEY